MQFLFHRETNQYSILPSRTKRSQHPSRWLKWPPGMKHRQIVQQQNVTFLPWNSNAFLLQDFQAVVYDICRQRCSITKCHSLHRIISCIFPTSIRRHHAIEPDLAFSCFVKFDCWNWSHYCFQSIVCPFELHSELRSPEIDNENQQKLWGRIRIHG